jgi:hypothetical protein
MVVGAYEGLKDLIADPKAFWDKKVQGAKNMINFISHFDTKIKEIASGIAQMPTETKVQMVCSFIGQLGGDALIAVLTAGAGAGKLMFSMEQYITKIMRLEKVFAVLQRVGKLKNIPSHFWERLASSRLPQSTMDSMMTFANHNIPDLLQGVMACAL